MTFGTYISGIVTVSIGVSVAVRILPEKTGNDGIRRSVIQVTSLILLICIVAPLAPLMGGIAEKIRSGAYSFSAEADSGDLSGLYDALSRESGEQIRQKLCTQISNKFDLAEENVTVYVSVTADGEGVRLESVTVCLTGNAMWQDPHEIIRYVEKTAGCPCDVVTGRD